MSTLKNNKAQYQSDTSSEEFRRVWNTDKVNDCLEMLAKYGESPGGNPFHDSDPSLRTGEIVFEYTEEEIAEIRKCAGDVIYFANTYCRAMTDNGVTNITVRDYQERVLKSFQDNRFNVFLASRQIGKCLISNTLVKISSNIGEQDIPLYELFYSLMKRNRKLSMYERLKYVLYKFESYLTYGKIYKLEI